MIWWDSNGQSLLVEPTKDEFDTRLWRKFLQYDAANPSYWDEFVRRTKDFIDSGYNKIGAKLIVELIRWDDDCRKKKITYNFSNDFHAYYARKFIKLYPEHKDLFEIRAIKRN